MKFVDIPDSKRIERKPDDRNLIFSDGKITQDGIEIKQIIADWGHPHALWAHFVPCFVGDGIEIEQITAEWRP